MKLELNPTTAIALGGVAIDLTIIYCMAIKYGRTITIGPIKIYGPDNDTPLKEFVSKKYGDKRMNDIKEVYFDQYCNKCKHKDLEENQEPCWECLTNGTNIDSHKPVNFEEETK